MGNFFDEYKALDRLCKDILESENGVTEYIERMEREERGRMIVADWDRDYKRLKSMRYLRNKIAHEDGIKEEDICSPSDTSWVMQFQDRIMAEEDPLTVLYNFDRREEESLKKPPKTKKEAEDRTDDPDPTPKKPTKPRKKKPTPTEPKQEDTVIKPRIDFINALAAILLLIGVTVAIIASCV